MIQSDLFNLERLRLKPGDLERSDNAGSYKPTLEVARKRLISSADAGGAVCPCCGQFAKTYKRKINSTMVASLIWLAHRQLKSGEPWVDVQREAPRAVLASRQIGMVAHWGLCRNAVASSDSTTRCSGYWQITERGLEFVRGEIRVPRHVYLYANVVKGWGDESTDVREALGDHFNYAELMAGVFK